MVKPFASWKTIDMPLGPLKLGETGVIPVLHFRSMVIAFCSLMPRYFTIGMSGNEVKSASLSTSMAMEINTFASCKWHGIMKPASPKPVVSVVH